MTLSNSCQLIAALLLLSLSGCKSDTAEPEVPTEDELVSSAETVCELIRGCLSPEETEVFDFSYCTEETRREVVGEVDECDWLWIELNECIVELTCEEYGFFDQTRQLGCGSENRKWEQCGLQHKEQ